MVERNFTKEALTGAEVRSIVKAAGGVAAVLNTRHALAKENGWKEHAPGLAAFVAAVQEQTNVIRRPILVKDGVAAVGKEIGRVRSLLG